MIRIRPETSDMGGVPAATRATIVARGRAKPSRLPEQTMPDESVPGLARGATRPARPWRDLRARRIADDGGEDDMALHRGVDSLL